jgi:WD40 repeat protein
MRLFIFLIILILIPLSSNSQTGFNILRTSGEVNHAIFFAGYSPDGNYIVTTGADLNVIVWNAGTNTIFRTLQGLSRPPRVAAFSPAGDKVASGGDEKIVSLWDIKTSRIIKTFELKQGTVKTIDISPDGKLIAAGGSDGSVRIWDIETKSLLFDLKFHKEIVNILKFSPDGTMLASAGADKKVVLWNVRDGKVIRSGVFHTGAVRDVAFSSDGSFISSCGDDSLIIINSVPDLNPVKTFRGHHAEVQSVVFSPDGKYLVSGSYDGYIFLWDFSTGEVLSKSEKMEQLIASVSFCPGKSEFISACMGSENFYTWTLTETSSISALEKMAAEKDVMMEKRAELEERPVMAYEKTASKKEARKETKGRMAEMETKSVNFEQMEIEKPEPIPVSPDIPVIDLYYPALTSGYSITGMNSTYVIGRVSNAEGTNVILINKKPVRLSEAGVFEYKIELAKGANPLDIITVNKKGKMCQLSLTIESTAENGNNEESGNSAEGKYYALLIGINNYKSADIQHLDNPIRDAQKLYDILVSNYTFEKENIIFLKDPALNDIITTLDGLAGKLTSKDNLLIFYAGHGYWDDKGKVGYWFPVDATKGSTVNWFRNSTLRDFIGSIQSKHTLLIADACFSGAILKTRSAFDDAPQGVQKLYDLPSRKAMTSGDIQAVADESTFMKYLVERLAANTDKFMASESLFSSFKAAVMNNSANMPQYGVIQNVGDEGGDFIFIKR